MSLIVLNAYIHSFQKISIRQFEFKSIRPKDDDCNKPIVPVSPDVESISNNSSDHGE